MTDGYREKSSDRIIFMHIIEKMTALGRVMAIGYRPAIGCDIYSVKFERTKSLQDWNEKSWKKWTRKTIAVLSYHGKFSSCGISRMQLREARILVFGEFFRKKKSYTKSKDTENSKKYQNTESRAFISSYVRTCKIRSSKFWLTACRKHKKELCVTFIGESFVGNLISSLSYNWKST